ncbi:MAG: DUF5005 domain-containing protein [Saprospiraceae bacterium]|nr:DUF5005 domain-containing protein [Saprospiraceae bacterium]
MIASRLSYRALGIKLAILLVLISFISCKKKDFTDEPFYPDPEPVDTLSGCWEWPISVRKDTALNNLFTRFGGGWTGADGTLSVPLPDGKTLWIFGDTFMGTVRQDRSRAPSGLINNTFAIQDGDQLTTLFSGSPSAPQAFVKPIEAGWWYWPGHGKMNGDTLEVIMFAMRSNGSTMWSFEYAAVDLLKFSYPSISLIERKRLIENPVINYGTCLLEKDGYTYIYGAEKVGLNKWMHVARCPSGSLDQSWTYFDGTGWSADPEASSPSTFDVSEQYSVFENDSKFYLMTQHHILGSEIYLFESTSPQGPFINKQLIFCTPETGGNIFTYNAFYHPDFSTNEEICISYNVNSFDFQDVIRDADNYRPWFVRVRGF